jgi:membrane fusion protein, heavy metal efflux system
MRNKLAAFSKFGRSRDHGAEIKIGNRQPATGNPSATPHIVVCVGVIVTAAVLVLTGCSPKSDGTTETPSVTVSNVTLTAAQREKIQTYTVALLKYHKTTEATGTVDFDNDQATSVLAPFGGPVARLLVAVGDRVKAGDPLAEVDSPDFAAAISAYRKALTTAQTLRRVADMDKDLLQHNGVAQREEEQAQTDAINAEADRDAALQALVSLNLDPQAIKDLQAGRPISRPGGMINSPIAGTVVEKLITPGELLSAGSTPCFTVANLSRVWVMAQLFGSDLASVSVGDPVEVESGIATNTFSGTVDNISALVNPDTRSVLVRVVVDNPGDFLKKQMYVRVRIQSRQESTGLLIPDSAILRDDENLPFVYVVQSDGSYARRHETLGYRTSNQYDIPAGLRAGDQVVMNGGLFLQFMQNQ